MKERRLTSTWRSRCFRMGGHATSAPCAESEIRKRFMPGTILKVFTSLVTSATIVTIVRKHLKPKMLSALVVKTFKNSTAERVTSECRQLRYTSDILEYLFKSTAERVPSECSLVRYTCDIFLWLHKAFC